MNCEQELNSTPTLCIFKPNVVSIGKDDPCPAGYLPVGDRIPLCYDTQNIPKGYDCTNPLRCSRPRQTTVESFQYLSLKNAY